MERTQSATELVPVLIEPRGPAGADVWLRRGIATVEVEVEDGLSQTMWEADSVHYVAQGRAPSEAEVLADFDALWDAAERAERESRMTDAERMAELAERAEVSEDALAELSELVSEDSDVNAEAIAELSQLVSDLYDMIGG